MNEKNTVIIFTERNDEIEAFIKDKFLCADIQFIPVANERFIMFQRQLEEAEEYIKERSEYSKVIIPLFNENDNIVEQNIMTQHNIIVGFISFATGIDTITL